MRGFQSFSKQARFDDLCQAVEHCTLCPRLRGRDKILSSANGNTDARVLFVAEAPGRLGADVTGIPLFGDQTGENFESLLESIQWCREDVFITNAVLCNPREENGTNSTPTSKEIDNCASYLEMTIELVDPEVVVTLGAVALNALASIHTHSYVLKEHVGQPLSWAGRILMPLYHPGPRARVHRSLEEQLSDFQVLAQLASPKAGILRELPQARRDEYLGNFQKLIYTIVQALGRTSYFKLTKLLYLVDLNALDKLGRSITGEMYLRQKEGPWPPVLRERLEPLKGQEVSLSFRRRMPIVEPGPSPRLEIDFENDELEIIGDVLERYGKLNDTGIKMAVYRTPPMRRVRELEKRGRNMHNTPIIYRDQIVIGPG